MRSLVRSVLFAAAVGLAAAGCGDPPPPQTGGTDNASKAPAPRPAGVELQDVTFAGLHAAVEQHRGKVVLVDVWSTFCAPCKKKFPHLVALHDQHAADGLVVITVTIDDKADRENALKFLKEKNATSVNYFLNDTDENAKKWEEKYPVMQLPVLIAHDRKGERVLTDFGKIGEAELDALVGKLLAEK